MHAAKGQRPALRQCRGEPGAGRFRRESPCQSAGRTVRGLPYQGSSQTGDDPMLSFVSVLSVNLIGSLAGYAVDSARVPAENTNPPEVRVMWTGGSSAPATMERTVLRTASRYLGTRYRFGGTKPGAFGCSGFVRYVFGRRSGQRHAMAREHVADEPRAVERARLRASKAVASPEVARRRSEDRALHGRRRRASAGQIGRASCRERV